MNPSPSHPISRNLAIAVAATVAAACATSSQAHQDAVTSHSTYVSDSGRVVHCVSTESGRTYCGAAHVRYTIAGTPPTGCVEGNTWGVDDRGVWVSSGCTADFTVVQEKPAERVYRADNAEVVHCVSTASGRTYCGTAHTRYVIHGTADPKCVEGRTWGVDDRGVWVVNGCTADFEIER